MNTRIRFRLRLARRPMAMLLVTLGLLALLAWQRAGGQQPEASMAATFAPYYYITDESHYPDEAPAACANGYHFASLWEIVDPSNLRYNSFLGQTTLDSGGGPPTIQGLGWVRTGINDANVSATAGRANCDLWSSRSNLENGSVAVLPQIWTTAAQDLFVWDVDTRTCNFQLGVWCKQDAPTNTYLPAVFGP